jgi:hypothetical protein
MDDLDSVLFLEEKYFKSELALEKMVTKTGLLQGSLKDKQRDLSWGNKRLTKLETKLDILRDLLTIGLIS